MKYDISFVKARRHWDLRVSIDGEYAELVGFASPHAGLGWSFIVLKTQFSNPSIYEAAEQLQTFAQHNEGIDLTEARRRGMILGGLFAADHALSAGEGK